jgi:hypothetical protein
MVEVRRMFEITDFDPEMNDPARKAVLLVSTRRRGQ